jgi:hypothetical protein
LLASKIAREAIAVIFLLTWFCQVWLSLSLTQLLLGDNKTSEVETLHATLASVDFSFAFVLLSGLYHPPGTRGDPYRNPLTLLKIELVKRFVEVKAYAEVYRRLQSSEEWRRVCDIGSIDTIPHPSTWTRFRKRVGAARAEKQDDQPHHNTKDSGGAAS